MNPEIYNSEALQQCFERMAQALRHVLQERKLAHPRMIGIHTGGAWVAQALHTLLQIEKPLGTLDISFYRDDFTRAGMHPKVRPSKLPFSVEDKPIILVDDVLQSGRTVRAALNEIFDYGRPSHVLLAVLTARSGRELPIQADVFGHILDIPPQQYVKLIKEGDQLRLLLHVNDQAVHQQ